MQAFFGNQPNGLPGLTYDFYDPPIPLEIDGSLFFDLSHVTGGRPGPPPRQDRDRMPGTLRDLYHRRAQKAGTANDQ